MRSMDSILADEPSVHTLPDGPGSDSPAETTSEAKPEPATPKVEAKAEPSTAPAETDGHDDESGDELEPGELRVDGLRKVVRKERDARKAAEKRIREIERQFEALQAQARQQPAQQSQQPAGDADAEFWTDPASFARQQAAQAAQSAREEIMRTRLDLSESAAKRAYADYGDKAKAFYAAAAQSRELLAQAINAPDPGEFVYQAGASLLWAQEVGSDPSAYKAKLRAEWEAERNGPTSAPPAKAPPKTLAGVRGNGASVTRSWSGPRSMKDILGG